MFVSKYWTFGSSSCGNFGNTHGEKSSVGGSERSDADFAVDVYTKVSASVAEMKAQ